MTDMDNTIDVLSNIDVIQRDIGLTQFFAFK